MPNRPLAGFVTTMIFIAFIVTGCGRMTKHLLAPDPSGSSPTEAATAEGPDAGDAVSASPEDDDRDDGRRATPITGPLTIDEPGDYRLVRDLEVAGGDGIVVTASQVRLWLGEHRLYGPGNKSGRAVVIDGAQEVKVRGGQIEHFGIGAVLISASRCRIRSLTIRGGDETADPSAGNPPQIGIMLVNSPLNRISGNRLHRVNLGIFVRGGGSYRNSVRDNAVIGGDHGLLAVCYNPAPGTDPAGPHDDLVKGNFLARFGTGIAASAHSAQNVFARNTIRYFTSAYVDQNGTNAFKDNRTVRITLKQRIQ